jgi:hypothetical protein
VLKLDFFYSFNVMLYYDTKLKHVLSNLYVYIFNIRLGCVINNSEIFKLHYWLFLIQYIATCRPLPSK